MSVATSSGPGSWQRLRSEAVAFDRRGLAPLRALRAALAMAAVLSAGLAAGDVAAGVSMAAGALLAGVSSLLAGPRPAPTMAAVSTATALATFAGSVTGSIPALHLALLVPWAFAAGMAGAISPEASTVGVQSAMAMIVFGRFAAPPAGALALAGWVFAGGAAQTALALATSAAGGLVAEVYDALAVQAAEAARHARERQPGDAPASSLGPAAALEAASRYLSSPALLGFSAARPLSSLVAEGERIRLSIAALGGLALQQARRAGEGEGEGAGPAPRYTELLEAAEALGAVADVLRRRKAPAPRAGAPEAVRAPSAAARRRAGEGPLETALEVATSARAAALAGQLRAAARLAGEASDAGGLIRRVQPRAFPVGPALRQRAAAPRRRIAGARARAREARAELAASTGWAAPQFRHAVRLAVVLLLCEVIATLSSLQRGYWIALTAGVVLRPDFASTVSRGATRILGTLLGVAVAGLVVLAGPGRIASTVLVGVLAWLAFTLFQASYVLFSSALTALVVVLLGVVTPDTIATAGYRLLDTVIGGCLALAAYRLWPTWSARDARYQLVRLAAAQRGYARAALDPVVTGGRPDRAALAEAAARARRERAGAEAAVGRAIADPAGHRIDPALTSAVLGDLRRLVFAVHALRVELDAARDEPPMPALAPLASAIDEAMRCLGNALAKLGRRPGAVQLPPLRELHDRLAGESAPGALGAAVVASTDEVVDAIDSAAEVLATAERLERPDSYARGRERAGRGTPPQPRRPDRTRSRP